MSYCQLHFLLLSKQPFFSVRKLRTDIWGSITIIVKINCALESFRNQSHGVMSWIELIGRLATIRSTRAWSVCKCISIKQSDHGERFQNSTCLASPRPTINILLLLNMRFQPGFLFMRSRSINFSSIWSSKLDRTKKHLKAGGRQREKKNSKIFNWHRFKKEEVKTIRKTHTQLHKQWKMFRGNCGKIVH